MSPADSTRRSKLLSLVLRHKPEELGLALDPAGWVAVEPLLEALQARDPGWSRAALERLVADSDKQRFELDGDRIRARQGHSVPVDLGLSAQTPPPALFHGTPERSVPAILAEGLTRQARHHVHLSADAQTARQVGARRGPPVVLQIEAQAMHHEGAVFLRSSNGVWLVDAVPPAFVSVVDAPARAGETPRLETPRLTLAPLQEAHADALQPHFARWEIIRHMSVRVPWPYPDDGMRSFVSADVLPRVARGEAHAWALIPRDHGEPVGLLEWRCSADSTDHRGFWIARDWQGRGLMTEAVAAFQDWVFREVGLRELIAHSAVPNVASRRVKEKTGAVLLGTVQIQHHGGVSDTHRWSLTRRAWLALGG